tara:strand:+ start:393 stop:638 length:246 start_codon:yes stop_codon:yes gene_type:complete
MDKLMDMAYELKTKLTDQEYLELNNNIMEVYKLKAIIIKEDGNVRLSNAQQTNIYNETSEDLAEWEVEDYNIEKDETLIST